MPLGRQGLLAFIPAALGFFLKDQKSIKLQGTSSTGEQYSRGTPS